MRDPARIDAMVEMLRSVWKRSPDLRLGQLICNMKREHEDDVFYVEDSDMIERLATFAAWTTSKSK